MGCERVIEIGPSNTLTVMAKRTVASQFKDRDEVFGIRRALLASENDTAEIQFENGQSELLESKKSGKADDSSGNAEQTPTPAPPTVPSIQPVEVPKAVGVSRAQVPDVPITAKAILVAMVAQKLKKKPESIRDTDSIKALAGGRSTLENELVGDIEAEFSGISIPERPESLSLADLATGIKGQFRGALGKKSTILIEKSVGSKMPAGYSLNNARAHLDSRWGLGAGRQDAVLLLSIATPPLARLAEARDARDFFDKLAKEYLAASGLQHLQDGRQANSHHQAAGATAVSIDPSTLNAIKESQDTLHRQTIEVYAKHLGIDLHADAKSLTNVSKALEELRAELAKWNNEHGEEYAAGIKPLFDTRKVRYFTSSWAWAIQDVFEIFHKLVAGECVPDEARRRISWRADPGARQALAYLQTVCQKESATSPANRSAGQVIDEIIRGCEQGPGSQTTRPTATPSSSFLKRKGESGMWQRDGETTDLLLTAQREVLNGALRLNDRTVLITGAGPGSIGSEVLIKLLAAGARVVVTTSSYSAASVGFYKNLYVEHSVSGSQLVVVPFNQGSQRDVQDLITWIYDPKGLGWDLDVVFPFAAISECGRQIDRIDSKSELAHRIMLTNTVRLIGAIKSAKQEAGYHHRPAQIVLPLSANHGIFGGDGLYAESKIALETLFDKWHSESWSGYLSITGAAIGWTRGTGLMKVNDRLAEETERQLGIQTFSQSEMVANLVALLHPDLAETVETYPIYADFNGGLDKIQDLSSVLHKVRIELDEREEIEASIAVEEALEKPKKPAERETDFHRRANIQLHYPRLPTYSTDLQPLQSLRGMVDLDSVVVIAGFAELGPWGNSRTRWEMEVQGTFSLEGWVEMAWITGRIKYFPSKAPTNPAGWVDAKTGAPVQDCEIEAKYGDFILNHSGIRVIEPDLWDNGYDPERKEFFHEIVVEADLEPFEASEDTAQAFKKRHGDHVDIMDGKIYIKKGTTIMVPNAMKFSHNIAGQIPTGFDPRTYGISEDIITQVDRNTLYALICTVEALFSAGITDAYEIYQYIHISELGNCLGTGVGGVTSAAKMYKGRSMEQQDVAKDVLQETFLNTPAAWVNMLLLSSSGPIRTPVGACATALESLDTAQDLILTGKAKMCLVGGIDDLEEHMAYEFANMKATNNNELDAASGRTPKEMSRPTASDRRGFIESHGAGVQIVCTAKLALDMGLPIYGIVAFSGTSSDKVGRSVPAPGKGVMVNVRERPSRFPSQLLSLDHRRRRMAMRRKQIQEARDLDLEQLAEEVSTMDVSDAATQEYQAYRSQEIQRWALQQEVEALRTLGTTFWRQHPEIAPIRGALAAWGLTIDDLTIASFHGTSTVKNELNECDIMQRQLTHLGRTPGNRLMGVFQKHLTGHPKGAAGAWMLNGCLQVRRHGLLSDSPRAHSEFGIGTNCRIADYGFGNDSGEPQRG